MARYDVKIVNNSSAKITAYYHPGSGGSTVVSSIAANSTGYVGFTDLSDNVQLWSELSPDYYEYEWSATPSSAWNQSSSSFRYPTFKLVQGTDNPTITLKGGNYNVSISSTTGGSTSPSGSSSYGYGYKLSISATSSSGYNFSYWITTQSSTPISSNPLKYTVKGSNTIKAYFTAIPYTMSFDGNGGQKSGKDTWSYTKYWNNSVSLSSEAPSWSTSVIPNTYKMVFKNYDGSEFSTSDITGSTSTTTHTLLGWNTGAGYKSVSDYYTVKGDMWFKADWSSPTVTTKGRLSSVAGTPSRWGYKFLNWMCDGSVVKAGNEYDGNKTATATWEPRKYNVSYSLYGNNAKWDDGQALVSFDKTFDSSLYLSEKIPSRFGYNFVGWHSNPEVKEENAEEWAKIIPAGGVFDDRFFNDSDKLVLYSIWKPIDQTCVFHYYKINDKGLEEEADYKETYNIETKSPYQGKAPKYSRGEDWVFLGWVKRDPEDLVWKDKWRDEKGIYRNPDKAPQDYTLPYEIYVETIQEWDPKNVTHLYGFWTITGKYVNIGGDWKKVSVAYINEKGNWIPMTGLKDDQSSFSVKILTPEGKEEWKKEVY